jgi:hypothetical protein
MKLLSFLAAAALVAASLPAQAQPRPSGSTAAENAGDAKADGLRIYRVTGVRDTGSIANTGIATVFQCSNLDTTRQKLQFRLWNVSGQTVEWAQITLDPHQTVTVATHRTLSFKENLIISQGRLLQAGMVDIYADTINAVCTAMVVDASTSGPIGIALHMQRYNPIARTEE